jgi:Putative Actinobacterial Holin-X, holin superfamily III
MSATTPGPTPPQTTTPQTTTPQGSAGGVAAAVNQLTEETRGLVQQELDSARREMLGKLTANVPAAALLGASGLMSVFALASSYRWVSALIEKRLPPASAAFVCLLIDASAAGATAVLGMRMLKAAPTPVPSETAQHAADVAVDVREGIQQGQQGA